MLNDNAKALVAALRSGEYKQGQGLLYDPQEGCYCIGGVAADLWGKANNVDWETLDEWGQPRHAARMDGERYCPSDTIVEFFGFANRLCYGPKNDDGDHRHSLIDDNDRGKTFAELADIIEREPVGLFA